MLPFYLTFITWPQYTLYLGDTLLVIKSLTAIIDICINSRKILGVKKSDPEIYYSIVFKICFLDVDFYFFFTLSYNTVNERAMFLSLIVHKQFNLNGNSNHNMV